MANSRNPAEVLRASPGRDNFARLMRLLISGGTGILRELFDYFQPPANLSTVLERTTLQGLTPSQRKTLFPSPGTCGQSTTFDITLLCKLFTDICDLELPKVTELDNLPNNTYPPLTHDIARIRGFRNEIYAHGNGDMDLSDEEFARFWENIKDVLLRIVTRYAPPSSSTLVMDWENAIKNLLTSPITHEEEIRLQEEQRRYLEDMEVKPKLEEMGGKIEKTRRNTEEILRKLEEPRRNTEVDRLGNSHITAPTNVTFNVKVEGNGVAAIGPNAIVNMRSQNSAAPSPSSAGSIAASSHTAIPLQLNPPTAVPSLSSAGSVAASLTAPESIEISRSVPSAPPSGK